MPAIKHQIPNSTPEISLGEIHIPDDKDLGTGTFTTHFKPYTLPAKKVFVSIMMNPPVFQIAATVNPNGDLPVSIGAADGTEPKHSVIFRMPQYVKSNNPHVLEIEFVKWFIFSAALDGVVLSTPAKPN